MQALIIGCGYLGRRVAADWPLAGHAVYGAHPFPGERANTYGHWESNRLWATSLSRPAFAPFPRPISSFTPSDMINGFADQAQKSM